MLMTLFAPPRHRKALGMVFAVLLAGGLLVGALAS